MASSLKLEFHAWFGLFPFEFSHSKNTVGELPIVPLTWYESSLMSHFGQIVGHNVYAGFSHPAKLPFNLRIELMRIEQKCLFLNERSKAGYRRSRLLQICAHASLLCLFVFIHETLLPPNHSNVFPSVGRLCQENSRNSLKWSIYQVVLWN